MRDDIKMGLKRNCDHGCGLDSFCSGWGPVTGFCKRDNESSGSIKGRKFLDHVIDH
jgi:hypothetical protein